MEYDKLSDEEIVRLARKKDNLAMDEIFSRYKKPINALARKFYLSGGDTEDLAQEAFFALLKAVESYDEENNASFKTFAITCAKNRIISEIKKSQRNKNKPLNDSISLSGEDGDDMDKSELAIASTINPESDYIESESEYELKERIKKVLSKMEYDIFTLYLQGYSYSEIAEKIGKESKSVDNAVQRIKKKAGKVIK